jgi:predicted regulator of Ras-like GTPase activity (Roadblock/LC7/MglB family)
MPLQGSLRELSLANLIQVNCQEMRSARLALANRSEKGEVYFSDGQVVHAVDDTRSGEEALFHMLLWEDGTFTLDTDVHAPETSIHTPWSDLLLEGMKRLSEWQTEEGSSTKVQDLDRREEGAMVPGTLTQLKTIDGVTGVVIAACDGVVLASNVPEGDGEREAAVAVFVGAAANQVGEAMQFEAFDQGIVTLKNKRVLVISQPDRYIGLWLAENASPAIVGNAATQILKQR